MRRIETLRSRPVARSAFPGMGWQEFVNLFGRVYGPTGSFGINPAASFVGYVRDVAERNGVVAASVTARALLVSQIHFLWRNNNLSKTPGRTFGDRSLSILEKPRQMTRPEMLYMAEQDVSYSGTWYARRKGDRLYRMRPDWVSVVMGSDSDLTGDGWVPSDAEILGFAYKDPARKDGPSEFFLPGEVIQWKPEPHPIEWWRGQSWITSVLSEIRNDGQATTHTSKFFEHAGTPNLVFTMDPNQTPEQIKVFAEMIREGHSGAENAYKNLFIGGGANVTVVGSEKAALDLKSVTGGYEARIASRARVPAVVLGIREGLEGSALNSGNYATARRLWADGWFTPTAENLCAAVERVMPAHDDADLAHDPDRVLFLQEDVQDAANVQNTKAQAIRQLVDAGYKPASVVEAIENDDFSRLEHSDLFSVQLQPPGSGTPATP